jgi:hypothetical protein
MQAWLTRHGLEVVASRSDSLSFGSFSITVSDGGLFARFSSDRDGFHVEVGLGYRWLPLKTVWAFASGLAPESAGDAVDWPMVDPYEHRDAIVAALRNPAISAYVDAADVSAFTALGLRVVE